MSESDRSTLYELMGGAETVRRLVEAFYPKVQQNPLLSPLFPSDIEPVIEKQFMFLSQFFGGPSLYSDRHGHPMMRARHMAFPITVERADAWLGCMAEAMVEVGLPADLRDFLLERLKGSAYHFINTSEEE
ncbi:globin [Paenibacillus alginolyticus]|uniref:Globin n=1 Tax=Paenibacillus alginolyticus TaxID=59839 RepID=A0ABT4GAY3_9BACL|nr:globin [Paenibacillus alginolyticus]MCY9667919.1 globin [Paenibacillus alginolyticus]MCY9693358.1 globin [Paenibacillus alginolyticus]MEC0148107.1 globin [Paenibacillus alginolyticus]